MLSTVEPILGPGREGAMLSRLFQHCMPRLDTVTSLWRLSSDVLRDESGDTACVGELGLYILQISKHYLSKSAECSSDCNGDLRRYLVVPVHLQA